jgi:uncharacterized membrane protein YkoI
MFRSKFAVTVTAVVLGIVGTGTAFAASTLHRDYEGAGREERELSAVVNAKTSLAQAIAVAENQTGGKAVESGVESRNGTMAYEVEISDGTTVQTVFVDPNSGQVMQPRDDAHHGESR